MNYYRGPITSGAPRRSFKDMAGEYERQAIQTYGSQRPGSKTEQELPGPTIGGAISAGVGGAAAGSAIGSAAAGASSGSAGGWWGAGIGFVVGMAAYYLS